jgi:hypothetical protein
MIAPRMTGPRNRRLRVAAQALTRNPGAVAGSASLDRDFYDAQMPRRQIWPILMRIPVMAVLCTFPRATKDLPVGTCLCQRYEPDSDDAMATNLERLATFWNGSRDLESKSRRMRDSFRHSDIGLLATQTKNCWRCQVHSDSSSWLC